MLNRQTTICMLKKLLQTCVQLRIVPQVHFCVLLLASLAYSSSAFATIPSSVSLAQLYAAADQVAIVQIEKGQLIHHRSGKSCGAKFTGRVIRSFKGRGNGYVLEFGPAPMYLVGNHYLVFLTKSTQPFLRLASTNSAHEFARKEHLKFCSSVIAPFDVMQMGMTSMEVSSQGAQILDWEIIWKFVVSLPASLQLADPKRDAVSIREFETALKLK